MSGGGEAPVDEDEWLVRAARALRIEPARWRRVLEGYARLSTDGADSRRSRLRALRSAYAAEVPEAFPTVAAAGERACPACDHGRAVPRYSRASSAGSLPLFVYGLCEACGHGLLLSSPEPESLYATAAYYERQNAAGAGYDRYEAEQDYRVAKGRRLLDRIAALAGRPLGTMVEVGSGFGFTRAAAAGLGLTTAGIDPNPAAAEAARRLHGIDTFAGTLESALDGGAIQRGAWDTVLYDFVLEHVADPVAELARAASLLAPDGVLALTLPSMAAAEVDVFAGGYRSFRGDHLHLFSTESIAAMLERAGLRLSARTSGCTVHLLKGVLTEGEMLQLYEDGKGPDLTVVARLSRH